MSEKPVLYRKRLIPSECIRLDNDEILLRSDSLLVTRWKTIRPKKELSCGASCYLLDKGWKVSRFLNHSGELICWYCDIIDYTWDVGRIPTSSPISWPTCWSILPERSASRTWTRSPRPWRRDC